MKFNLEAKFTFNTNILSISKEIESFIFDYNNNVLKTDPNKTVEINIVQLKDSSMFVDIISQGNFRPHTLLLQIKNAISKELGEKYHVGTREIDIVSYKIDFELDRPPLKKFSIPFADIEIKEKKVTMILKNVDEEFIRKNYIDRMINLIKEKAENQYYAGKGEYWKLIWESEEKTPLWQKDPTEEMLQLRWLKQGPTKGKWFYRPQITAILKTMEKIAIEEIIKPLGFQEIIESHIVPFNIWLKTGHMEGMPGEFYYVVEPATRDVEKWEKFVDLTKIQKEIPYDELNKNLNSPNSGICYAQCPNIYWSFKGKTISEKSLPILIYDSTANSCRYESGGRHGIERVDEFHRIEPVYIGTREQLLDLRERFLNKYKHVFNEILDLEWRMAWVTPWYMAQAGKIKDEGTQDTGTIDFEAYLPYRGSRKDSEWLEFQNLSVLGNKYVKAFNIKAQKSSLWSGCSGIGLERWTSAFLAQKGIDPDKWPEGFRKYLNKLPDGIEFL